MSIRAGNLMFDIYTPTETHKQVETLRRSGYDVRSSEAGYTCHEITRYGLALVFAARKVGKVYHISLNLDFCDTGKCISTELH